MGRIDDSYRAAAHALAGVIHGLLLRLMPVDEE